MVDAENSEGEAIPQRRGGFIGTIKKYEEQCR